MWSEIREPLAALLAQFPPEVITELRATAQRLSRPEAERLKLVSYRLCPGVYERDDWREFDALPASARAEVEVGLGLSVLDTIDGINTFLALCELKD
jgi:hypothetical protein